MESWFDRSRWPWPSVVMASRAGLTRRRRRGLLLVQATGLVCRHHVLDVDERVGASRLLKRLERRLHQVSNVVFGELNRIAQVSCRAEGGDR